MTRACTLSSFPFSTAFTDHWQLEIWRLKSESLLLVAQIPLTPYCLRLHPTQDITHRLLQSTLTTHSER